MNLGEHIHKKSKEMIRSEAEHCEHFLIELFDITAEEESQASKWVTAKIAGHDPGPFPPSMQRIAGGHLPDEKMLTLCKKYRMKDTQFREQLLRNIYNAAIGGGSNDITGDHS